MSAIPSPLRAALLALAPLAAAPAQAAAPPAAPGWRPLTGSLRARVDRLALAQPAAAVAPDRLDLAGNVPAWLLSQVGLTPAEELHQARAQHKEVVAAHRPAPALASAERLLARLVGQLPPHFKPAPFRYTLTVLEAPGLNAFATGGGLLYVTRPLLEALRQDRARGEAALAFVLAHEVGHTALQHCRRGWQLLAVEAEARKGIDLRVEPGRLRDLLQTGARRTGTWVEFLYSRDQQYEADAFALHLCRNAGVPEDAALDALRHLALLHHPRLTAEPGPGRGASGAGAFLSADPGPLLRLKRLLLERDGLVEEADYGLFERDRGGALKRCGDRSVAAADRPVVFVHGLRGGKESFAAYLAFFAKAPELRGRKLLVFRYPNNASLARCGRYLSREMRRVVTGPRKAVFVCHSAGGLVFRHYAEVGRGDFDRAVLLATPHAGSDLTGLKFLVDLGELAGELPAGLSEALARTVPEGRGEVTLDLHPDSLFLRHLGHDAARAARYHVFYGQHLTPAQALALRAAFAAGKRLVAKKWVPRLGPPARRAQAQLWLDELHLPEEVLRGDLIVSVRSAALPGAGRLTRTALHHQAFKSDPALVRQVLESITAR
jgi:Zn-dependent protease with chaperone function